MNTVNNGGRRSNGCCKRGSAIGFKVNQGTFSAATYAVSALNFTSSGGLARTLNLGTANTWTITGNNNAQNCQPASQTTMPYIF